MHVVRTMAKRLARSSRAAERRPDNLLPHLSARMVPRQSSNRDSEAQSRSSTTLEGTESRREEGKGESDDVEWGGQR